MATIPQLTREETDKLVAESLRARDLTYSPYSKFRVGAALLDASSPTIILGKRERENETSPIPHLLVTMVTYRF